MTKGYKRELVLEQIEGCGGIMLTVAQRLGCDWMTAKRYVEMWESTRAAFEAEKEKILDLAESLLAQNIRYAYRMQNESKEPVDSSDAKWILSRLGKKRGYADKVEQEITGAGGGAIQIIGIDPDAD